MQLRGEVELNNGANGASVKDICRKLMSMKQGSTEQNVANAVKQAADLMHGGLQSAELVQASRTKGLIFRVSALDKCWCLKCNAAF